MSALNDKYVENKINRLNYFNKMQSTAPEEIQK